MRAAIALAYVFSAATFNAALNGGTGLLASAQRQSDKVPYILRSCDQFPGRELDVAGTVTFLRNMDCTEPTVMHIAKSLVLRSHADLDTKNIHFVVHKGATLTLRAPAMMIARDEGSTLPLFDVSGKLTFDAAGSIPALMQGSVEDDGGVVRVKDGVTVETAQEIRYHADSVTVSKMAEPGEKLGDSDRQPVELSTELKVSLAAYHAKIKAAPDFDSPPTSSAATASSSSSTPATSESSHNDGESEASFLSSYFDTPGGPGARHAGQSRQAPTDTASTNGEDDNERHTTSDADLDGMADRKSPGASPTVIPIPAPTSRSSPIPIPSSTPNPGTPGTSGSPNSSPSRSPSPTANPYPGSPSKSNRDSPSPSHSHGQNNSPAPTPTPTPTTSCPGGSQWEFKDDRSGSQSNNHGVSGPKLALRVGEVLRPPALSWSGTSILWPAEDCAIMFRKISDASPDVPGAEGTARTAVSTVMVAPDAGRLKRVFLARMALRKEKQNGSTPATKTGTRGAWVWVPWRRQHLQDVDKARGRLGQVEMTLDDRAGLGVSVDGTRVASRSGSNKREWVNRFPWRRRKNKAYELYVTEEGFEVQLGGGTVWGITADVTG